MKITPTSLTITQLFSNDREQFVIPAYQRRYSWHSKHIAELFDDINLLDERDDHLLGSIVCLTQSHGAGVNELELVDGQQRITTIMLFLKVLVDRYKAIGNTKEAEKISNYLYCSNYDFKQKSKLSLGDLDQSDFGMIMGSNITDDIINKRLLDGYRLIYSCIEKLSVEDLDRFKYKFVNQAYLIRLDVAEAKDAFKLFETINNRGLNLSPSDIIKNFLLGNASQIDETVLSNVKSDWTKLIICMDDQNLDDFFRQYMMGVLGRKIPESLLIDTFKKYFNEHVTSGEELSVRAKYLPSVMADSEVNVSSSEDPVDTDTNELVQTGLDEQASQKISIVEFVSKLRKSAEVYSKILKKQFEDAKINQHLFNLERIRSFASYTFILNLLQRNLDSDEIYKILKLIETFMLRRNIAEYRTSELDDIFSALALSMDNDLYDTVRIALRPHLPNDAEFEEKVTLHNFKGQLENRAKYMLEQIESLRTGDTHEKVISSAQDVHLEHIIPQTITTKKAKEEFGDWELYLGEDATTKHRSMVGKIGNLTLLAAPLNIRASNNPFHAKKEEYSKSVIEITRDLTSFDEFKFIQAEDRTAKLAKLALQIWSYPDVTSDELNNYQKTTLTRQKAIAEEQSHSNMPDSAKHTVDQLLSKIESTTAKERALKVLKFCQELQNVRTETTRYHITFKTKEIFTKIFPQKIQFWVDVRWVQDDPKHLLQHAHPVYGHICVKDDVVLDDVFNLIKQSYEKVIG